MRRINAFGGKRRVRRADQDDGAAVVKYGSDAGRQLTLLSVNGALQSTREPASKLDRRHNYRPVGIGRPMVVEYLRFRLFSTEWERGNNELLISNYIKTSATRQQAGETIAYLDNEARPDADGYYELNDWGAKNFGHPLIYYTRSYLGESIYLTVQVTELDELDTSVLSGIKTAFDGLGSLPIFSSVLPFMSVAQSALNVAQGLQNWLHCNDEIIPFHNLDLHCPTTAGNRMLQSGRYVCLPDCSLTEADLMASYCLDSGHALVSRDTGEPYAGGYFVFKVNAESQPMYESFDDVFAAAHWMESMRSRQASDAWLRDVVSMVKSGNDFDLIRRIEDLQFDLSNADSRDAIQASWNHLSVDMKRVYEERFRSVLAWRRQMPDVSQS